MKVPFTWKVTGWFMVGWSPECPVGETRPLRYFGDDLVAYRDEDGALHVMEAHCKHLGAHLGHGGTVVVPPADLRHTIEKQFLSTVFDDLQIWRYQRHVEVENPVLSRENAKGYRALRKWARQFDEVPA